MSTSWRSNQHQRVVFAGALMLLATTACQQKSKPEEQSATTVAATVATDSAVAGRDPVVGDSTVASGAGMTASGTGPASSNAHLSDTHITAAKLERGPCYGRCPEYVVEVSEDGAVRFEPRKNVSAEGVQRSTISKEDVQRLMQAVAATPFATADSAYIDGTKGCGHYRTDAPLSTLTFLINGSLKTVRRDPGCEDAPAYLKALELKVDSVARVSGWVAKDGKK